MEDSHLEFDAGAQARLDALERLYVERAPGLAARPATVANALSRLQRAVDGKRLGPAGRPRATDLVAVLQLEQGRWQGRPVDAAALDALAQAGEERTLRWAIDRLPEDVQRGEARRRVIRLHLDASPFPEVREHAAAVEEAVLATGVDAVSLADHPPVRGWLDPATATARAVVVQQRLLEQSARLLGYTGDAPTPAVIPALPIRGTLHVELVGLSLPVTVCAPPRELDVTPCLAPEAVQGSGPLVAVGADGLLHVSDAIAEDAAVALARHGPRLVESLLVAGRPVAELSWPVTFAAPADLVLSAEGAGARGPDLDVRVDARVPRRLIYAVDDGRRSYQAVVERTGPEARGFQVVSRGASGSAGLDGSSGSDGSGGADGMSASCPSFSGGDGSAGGNGGSGGDGGPGGEGGAGGDVRVTVHAAEASREAVAHALATTIRSEGGRGGGGGEGGAGGRGGRGGHGGSGATCTDSDGSSTSVSGGSDGQSGSDGARGSDGPSGSDGAPGRVTFSLEQEP